MFGSLARCSRLWRLPGWGFCCLACRTFTRDSVRRSRNYGKMTRASSFFLIFAMLVSAGPLDLSAWKYRKRIPVVAGDGLAVVKLDRQVYAGAAFNLSDLRVIQDGFEVPFDVGVSGFEGEDGKKTESILDMSVLDGANLRFTVHVPFSQKNRILLEVAEQNFRQRASIEASDDK